LSPGSGDSRGSGEELAPERSGGGAAGAAFGPGADGCGAGGELDSSPGLGEAGLMTVSTLLVQTWGLALPVAAHTVSPAIAARATSRAAGASGQALTDGGTSA
jgi:hypothetical protein